MDTQEIKALIAQSVEVNPEDLFVALRSPIALQSNRLYDVFYRGDHWIAKEYLLPREQQDSPKREFRALERLASLDIAPQPVAYRPDLGPVVIYQYLEGDMWDRRTPTAAELAQLAEVWLKVQSLPCDDWPLAHGSDRSSEAFVASLTVRFHEYENWADHNFPPGLQPAHLCLDLLHERTKTMEELRAGSPLLRFCRSDPRFANVIRRPDGRLGLVDWEDCGVMDPAIELADLIVHANQEDLLSQEEWQAFLKPYFAARKDDSELPERFLSYLGIVPLIWLAVLIARGMRLSNQRKLSDWSINQMDPNVRLRRYLARLQAWPAVDFSMRLNSLDTMIFFLTEV